MGTAEDKLARLAATKADIKAALTEMGAQPSDVFSSYGEEIRKLTPGSGGGAKPGQPLDPAQVYKDTRPADWLPMPAEADVQDNEMYLLFHIPDGVSSLLAFTVTCTGSYTVALGTMANGAFVQKSGVSIASGAKYEAKLYAKDYGDITSTGMKQVVIKVSGTDILTWELSTHSKKTLPSSFANWNIVEIACRLTNGTEVRCGSSTLDLALKKLRYFSLYGQNAVTSMSSMFSNCNSLTPIPRLDTARVANMGSMSNSCHSLTSILFDPFILNWAGQAIFLGNCSLGHTALVNFFNSLPAITAAKAITLTGNPDVAELTEAEKAIATGKGWTLTL